MQTQNSAEREKSKKGRQDPAPPPGSKAGGIDIAKEFVDFLLEHDIFSLRSPTQASHSKDIDMTHLLLRISESSTKVQCARHGTLYRGN